MSSQVGICTENKTKDILCERDRLLESLLKFLNKEKDTFNLDSSFRRLDTLKKIFLLNDFETQVIAVLWNGAFVPELNQQLSNLDQMKGVISPLSLSCLFNIKPLHRLSYESPLIFWDLIKQQEFVDGTAHLTLAHQLIKWLEDGQYIEDELIPLVEPVEPSFTLSSWEIDSISKDIDKLVKENKACNIIIKTNDIRLAQAFLSEISKKLKLPINLYRLINQPLNHESVWKKIQKHSFLHGIAPGFLDYKESNESTLSQQSFPIQFFIFKDRHIAQFQSVIQKELIFYEIPKLSALDKEVILKHFLPSSRDWSPLTLNSFTSRTDVSATDIYNLSVYKPTCVKEANRILDDSKEQHLGSLVQKIDSDFCWNDLVIPEDTSVQLKEILFEAKERNSLWDNIDIARLFPQGRGLVAMFAGPPGSGKTMAAQVMANELGKQLLRVDLSCLVSKWVGETIENIQKVLDSDISNHSIIFFDEADAIFGRRVDDISSSNDRYLNMDSGHLMVALENYEGIVLLATNLRGNIDPAFSRRIRHVVEFSKPSVEARINIWRNYLQVMFHSEIIELLRPELERLSNIEATGAQIKNACLSSLLATKRKDTKLTSKLLGQMIGRELAKDGRGLSEKDLNKVLEDSLL